jgi:outer membrane receptor protein involved in Fe transport
MKQRLLVSSIVMGLCASLSIGNALAQSADDQNADQKKKETTELTGITVTGSLIPRAQIETATPVVTITSEDMDKQGFKNVYDALRSMPTAVGSVQDSQFTNSFTPGANTISLLGLDPSFTLVLMNGKPLADYPFLYNSNSNFVDLATIPNFLVDHIDIVLGNQSAIYGSAAIAGVINIVTKQKLEGFELSYRLGGYTDGGGQQQRLELAGGHSWGNLDVMFGIELNNQNPIWGYQRKYTDNAADNPTLHGGPPIAQRDRVMIDGFTGKYDDPGQATCSAISNLFKGDEAYRTRAGFGNYCGSNNGVAVTTFLNERKSADGYGSVKYQLNDSTSFYGDLLVGQTKTKYFVGGTSFWATGVGMPTYIWDIDDKKLVRLQHIFAPEEIGNQADGSVKEDSYVVNAGVRGTFGSSSSWNYDIGYHRSQYEAQSSARRLLTDKVNDFFLGPQDGTDPYGYGYPGYHIRQQGHFWGAITPAQFDSVSDFVKSDSQTYTQQLNATVTNTDVFSLPAGSVGFAGIAEWGNQYWDNPVDPRVTAGEFWGTGGTSGHGTRDRGAVAAEFNIPIFSMLSADVSGRYDNYSAAGSSQGKFTYKIGLEFRPFDTLLLRTNYATAFRAPDMGYIFSTGSAFYTSATDYYNCRKQQGDAYKNCNPPYNTVQIQGFQNGNKDLKYITAKSWGYGAVWSPVSNFNLKVDYYHINIDNEVNSYSIDTILQKEADCRLGHTRAGVPVDGNSASCQQFIAYVGRNPLTAPIAAGQLNSVTTVPINVSDETLSGVIASGQYRFDMGRFGNLSLAADYNTTLEHQYRQFPTDPVDDLLRDNNYYNQFKNIGSGTVGWDIGSWSTTFHGTRYGKSWSYDGSYTVAPWMVYNATVQYNFSDDAAMTLIGNNIFNSRPPIDRTYSAYPYYNIFNYNSFGRLVMLELNVHFGAGKKD